MKWFSKTRFGAFIAVLATAFILVACGGGGSSSEPVAATQPGQQGGSTAADSSTTPPPTGEVCTTGLIIDNICQPAPAHYSRKVVALWDGGYPFMVTATGVTRAINKTSFAGTQPFINCGLLNADRVEADGHVQVKCTYVGDSKRYIIQLDPATGELSDFHGTELPDDQFVLAENNSVQPVAGTTSALGEDGWYYANPNGRVELDLLRSDGTTTVVKQGSLQTNGNLNVLRSYTF